MHDDPLDYAALLQEALRQLVRRSLKIVAEHGLHGEHHFYLTFHTRAPDVILPGDLLEHYPEEMTIVLKTQFRDLVVEDDLFSVVLFFGGIPHHLTVPFAALKSFADPSVSFQLAFEAVPDTAEALVEVTAEDAVADEAPADEAPADEAPADQASTGEAATVADDAAAKMPASDEPPTDNVVSFAGFRKKK